MFWAKTIFSAHFGKFLVTTPCVDMTKGYIGTLFSFQIFLISRSEFSDFVILSASVLERL